MFSDVTGSRYEDNKKRNQNHGFYGNRIRKTPLYIVQHPLNGTANTDFKLPSNL